MRIAHFDCFSGISGDMTLGCLIDAGVPKEPILDGIRSLGLPVEITVEKIRKGGFAATQVLVETPHEHAHRHLHHIEKILAKGSLTPKQLNLATKIFRKLGEAEAKAHGISLEKVHFHEVGALDSIADIAGAAIGIDLLGVDRITCGSVPTGSGTVKCDHGIMPVPTPATAELLTGVPLRPSPVKSELTTPTGAAILATIVEEWTDSPAMTIERIGVGAGRKEFIEQPNICRLFVGSPVATANSSQPSVYDADSIWVVETNLDDVSGEVIGYCFDRLFAVGAVDVFTTPIQMKKNRPGVVLTVLAPEAALAAVEEILFRETLTFGIRRHRAERHKLHRKPASAKTPWGDVAGKLGWRNGGEPEFTPEYNDCARIAKEAGVPLREVLETARAAGSLTATEN